MAQIGTSASAIRRLIGDVDLAAPIKHPIAAPAVLEGARGKAWLVDLAALRRAKGISADDDGALAHWVVEAPGAHPCWHSYSVVLIHLRPLPGVITRFYRDNATHEIWVVTIDPDVDRNVMLTGHLRACWLQPHNFAAQFVEIADHLAQQRVRAAVQSICAGTLSPDTDFIAQWVALFGDNMMRHRP
ncbi:hypothetical protein [Bradyrhizobium sp.]|uniref:hypothetical protein n=1 Tax=Bradyrhizobium sp. TaxID=376 RepID=UPI0025BAF605|nr:hypothetical protein [Bradyrhizobium sp.]